MSKASDFLENKIAPLKECLIKNWVKLLAFILVLGVIAWAAYLRIFKNYGWAEWIEFGESSKVIIPPAPGVPTVEYHPAKTIWDLTELLVVPGALALIAVWFNWQERKSDREISAERQRENALQAYLDKMTELLLEKNLRTSEKDSEERHVARARTLTTLRVLDGERKGLLVRFLNDASLIMKRNSIVNLEEASLEKANLEGVDLHGTNLVGANLQGANLKGANLEEANLEDAILSKAYLNGALLFESNLYGAVLEGADLEGAGLYDACLFWSILYKANLRKAQLERANLQGADLQDANLEEANLKGVEGTTPDQLEKAKSLKGATMPDGTVHE